MQYFKSGIKPVTPCGTDKFLEGKEEVKANVGGNREAEGEKRREGEGGEQGGEGEGERKGEGEGQGRKEECTDMMKEGKKEERGAGNGEVKRGVGGKIGREEGMETRKRKRGKVGITLVAQCVL